MPWSKARAADQGDLVTEKFFTDDKKSRSLYNFIEGANPELVHEAFRAGLVRNIYPSANLQELKCFPKELVKAIKKSRTKILKASDQPLYINVTSLIPDWELSTIYSPYYFLEIGLAKKKEFSEPVVMEEHLPGFTEQTMFRVAGLKLICNKLLAINTESRMKVNFCNDHCILTSWCKDTISNEDIRLIKMQLCDICLFKDFTCEYEKNLFKLPQSEYPDLIEQFLAKLPIIGEGSLANFKEVRMEHTIFSLGLAVRIAEEQIQKICEQAKKQKQLFKNTVN